MPATLAPHHAWRMSAPALEGDSRFSMSTAAERMFEGFEPLGRRRDGTRIFFYWLGQTLTGLILRNKRVCSRRLLVLRQMC
jgi:hypothetical protein